MSNTLLNAAFAAPGLSTAEKMVLVVLANEVRDRHVDLCWPGMESIAAKASMTVRGVQKIIKRLGEMGLIEIAVRGGRGMSNRYRIILDQTPNHVQGLANVNPEPRSVFYPETPNQSALNPEPRSGEPLEPLEKDGDADSASAEIHPPFREKIIVAMGLDPSGITATGKQIGNPADMLAVARWTGDLSLTETEILSVIEATAAGRAPIQAFRYFDGPMQKFAAEKARPPLTPEKIYYGNADHRGSQTGSARRGGFGSSGRQGGYGGGMAGAAARSEAKDRAAMDVPHREEWREPAQLSDRDGGFGRDRE
jgi:DNA-binding MarR family transcriptional regulator